MWYRRRPKKSSIQTTATDTIIPTPIATVRPKLPGGAIRPREFYEREVYKKYEISAVAAAEFEKKPCPVCVKKFEPVYLGDHLPEWNFDVQPWQISGVKKQTMPKGKFQEEVASTYEAFYAYYEQYADPKTGAVKTRHAYPDCFASLYRNVQGSYTYMIVEPTDEILATFERMFGGGAWIISAKYGVNEMDQAFAEVMNALDQWKKENPDLDAGLSSGGGDAVYNCVEIGLYGDDWQLAAAAMDEIAPIYVRFYKEEQFRFADS